MTGNFTMQNDNVWQCSVLKLVGRSMLQCEDIDKNLYVEILKEHNYG